MNRRLVPLLAVVLLTTVAGPVSAVGNDPVTTDPADSVDCEFPVSVTDDTGTEVTVEEEPQRIVTLNPSAAQTMWEIGGKEKVVGVSRYASYLEGAGTKTNISASGQRFFALETIIGLQPDLVLAPNTISNDTVAKLRTAGLTVYKAPYQSTFADIERITMRMGQLSGECAGARSTVDRMDHQLKTVREATDGEDNPRVLYVFSGYTAGKYTFADAVIEAAGGTNVATEANISGYGQLSQEVVLTENPEWIVVHGDTGRVPTTAAYNRTHAVENGKVVAVQPEYITQPAPRIVRPVVTLTKAFHPEAYAQVAGENGTATTNTTENETRPPPTVEPARAPSSETDSTPGFGVGSGIAALALALTGLLVGRFDG